MKKWTVVVSVFTFVAILAASLSGILSKPQIYEGVSALESDFLQDGDPLEYLCRIGVINGYEDGQLRPEYPAGRGDLRLRDR